MSLTFSGFFPAQLSLYPKQILHVAFSPLYNLSTLPHPHFLHCFFSTSSTPFSFSLCFLVLKCFAHPNFLMFAAYPVGLGTYPVGFGGKISIWAWTFSMGVLKDPWGYWKGVNGGIEKIRRGYCVGSMGALGALVRQWGHWKGSMGLCSGSVRVLKRANGRWSGPMGV